MLITDVIAHYPKMGLLVITRFIAIYDAMTKMSRFRPACLILCVIPLRVEGYIQKRS